MFSFFVYLCKLFVITFTFNEHCSVPIAFTIAKSGALNCSVSLFGTCSVDLFGWLLWGHDFLPSLSF